jgi:hypothetical protein
MQTNRGDATAAAVQRLDLCYSGPDCDWPRFYQPKDESMAMGSRYHLVYSALAHFVELKRDPSQAGKIRPQLDTIYRGLIDQRCWKYWHAWLDEQAWPLEKGNLTYAGRVATFIGFYIDAFGAPPAARIELDGRTTTYSDLSRNLWEQAAASPSCSVSCFNNSSMVQCNAHMLINNVLHDRLFGTNFSAANADWLSSVEDNLLSNEDSGSMFYFGTQPNKAAANVEKRAIGTDIWALFLMSGVVPERVSAWFESWQRNVVDAGEGAYVQVGAREPEEESSTNELATAWAYCLAKELGQTDRADRLRRYLSVKAQDGFAVDPYTTGLFLLGERLEAGAFFELINGVTATPA